MKLLITGFEPFGQEAINPSQAVLELLPKQLEETRLCFLTLPVAFGTALPLIEEAIRHEKPDVVLSLGQAGGRAKISLERVGINLDDARIADNEGYQPIDVSICPQGPDAYFSNLPLKAMLKALHQQAIPAEISNTAGTFVCNHVLYGVRAFCAQSYPTIRSGFVHLPYLPEQAVHHSAAASMSLAMMRLAVLTMIEAIEANP